MWASTWSGVLSEKRIPNGKKAPQLLLISELALLLVLVLLLLLLLVLVLLLLLVLIVKEMVMWLRLGRVLPKQNLSLP